MNVLLASTSRFRRELLARFLDDFAIAAPDCDETPWAGEDAKATAIRLAREKALSLQTAYPQTLIIGSDQVALHRGEQLGKPMTQDKAAAMLRQLSGETLDFYTALCVVNSATGEVFEHCDHTRVTLRQLTDAQISRYLTREPDAIFCAGAAKSEGLGGCLIQKIESTDPNALIGLPLFALVDILQSQGLELP